MTSKLKVIPGHPEPFRPLGKAGREFWDRTLSEYSITDSAGLDILQIAASATDRAEFCREALERDGLMVTTESGVLKEHPLLKAEQAALGLILRSIRQLGIDCEPIRTSIGRPSGLATGWRG